MILIQIWLLFRGGCKLKGQLSPLAKYVILSPSHLIIHSLCHSVIMSFSHYVIQSTGHRQILRTTSCSCYSHSLGNPVMLPQIQSSGHPVIYPVILSFSCHAVIMSLCHTVILSLSYSHTVIRLSCHTVIRFFFNITTN